MELSVFMTNNGLEPTGLDTATTTKQQRIHINPCQSRKSNPGQLIPQTDALPLDHQDN